MTDFLNPVKWKGNETFLSTGNANRLEQMTADTRMAEDSTQAGATEPTDFSAFFAKMRRYEFNFDLVVKANTDVVIPFPAPKDNANYGVIITIQKDSRYEGYGIGNGGQSRTGYSLNVVARTLNSVTVRFQTNAGPDSVRLYVSCVGGINF